MLIDFKKAVWTGVLFGMFVAAVPGVCAQEQTDALRKVTYKVVPVYPRLAMKMQLAGTVRVLATVTPEGAVKSVRTLGGHPVLASAAEEAVKRWKYESSKKETTESVVLTFEGPQ